MKISNKEKIILCILGSVIVGFGYYKLVFLKQKNIIEEKTQRSQAIEEEYNTAIDTIDSIDNRRSDIKILKTNINKESLPFYPAISEEHLIVELNTLLDDSGLKAGMKFEPIASDIIENEEKERVNLPKSSLSATADAYSVISKGGTGSNKKDLSGDSNKDKLVSASNNKVHYLKCSVDFEGSYDSLYKFLDAIGNNEKKIVVNSISASKETIDGLSGNIKLEIYAIPKINEEIESYLKWDLNNTYGKGVPFNRGASRGKLESKKETSDFVAAVRSTNSELPTISLGKSGDNQRTSYAYADSNTREGAEITLTKDGDKYYYKFKTSTENFPENYGGVGVQFTPVGENIVINVLSEQRANSSDKAELKLKIENKTDKLVQVDVVGEDKANPRVKIEGNGSKIIVNQK